MTGDSRVPVAAFDVDGTLTTRDCVVPFLGRFGRRSSVLVRALAHAPRSLVALARRDRDGLRAAATAVVLGGIAVDDLEREAEAFAATVVGERLRPDTTARLAWHRDRGHRVVLVSASYEVYVTHLARALGAEAVLATRLEIGADRRCTGLLVGRNCRADEKVARLASWLRDAGLARDEIVLWAYGDSAGDRELLAYADHPVWVREPLASVAPSS